MNPIYTAANCGTAYQLNWSLSVFWRQPVAEAPWLEGLQAATEPDGVRVLRHCVSGDKTSQFLLSTQPHVTPEAMVRIVKGRLQHLLGRQCPKPFRRKYGLRSMGSVGREAIESYVRSQHHHHPAADPEVQALLQQFQIAHPEVDLSEPRATAHARYWYNLHVVLVNEGRWRETDKMVLAALRDMIAQVSRKRGHRLAQGAVLADHIHLALGCALAEAPLAVGLCYMNNLAFASGMRPIFRSSMYLGTFGEYDLSVPGFWPRGDV